MKPKLKSIAAMALDRAIGRGNDLPWRIPGDLRWFRKRTTGCLLIMGRKTFESMGGKPLPNRETMVLTRQAIDLPGVKVLRDIEAIPTLQSEREIFICGGAEIYRQTMPWVDELFLTVVQRKVPDADAYFPPFEAFFQAPKLLQEEDEFSVFSYLKKTP